MSNQIKNVINTAAWKEVEVMFNKAISKCENEPVNENLSGDDYKSTSMGNIKAAKKMKALLTSIRLAGGVIKDDKKVKYI